MEPASPISPPIVKDDNAKKAISIAIDVMDEWMENPSASIADREMIRQMQKDVVAKWEAA